MCWSSSTTLNSTFLILFSFVSQETCTKRFTGRRYASPYYQPDSGAAAKSRAEEEDDLDIQIPCEHCDKLIPRSLLTRHQVRLSLYHLNTLLPLSYPRLYAVSGVRQLPPGFLIQQSQYCTTCLPAHDHWIQQAQTFLSCKPINLSWHLWPLNRPQPAAMMFSDPELLISCRILVSMGSILQVPHNHYLVKVISLILMHLLKSGFSHSLDILTMESLVVAMVYHCLMLLVINILLPNLIDL